MDTEKSQWYSLKVEKILELLETSEQGLTEDEAKVLLGRSGSNEMKESPTPGHTEIFLEQFKSPLIYLLLTACFTVFALGDVVDGAIILVILFFNAVIGTIQEGRAQETLKALRRFTKTNAIVLREGKEVIIPDTELVVGDVLVLREGNKVPADARIILSHSMQVDEAMLTGESEPVYKQAIETSKKLSTITEADNLIFKGTHIMSGNGVAVVFAIGNDTEIGKLAGSIAEIDTEIPLRRSIRHLSYGIVVGVLILSAGLFALGVSVGEAPGMMFRAAVSILVSVVPEGLPVVLTLVLATGVWRMGKRNALVKKMQAVEALGQATIIAVDKTGTITMNELVVRQVALLGSNEDFTIEGEGYETHGAVKLAGATIEHLNHPDLVRAGLIASFCAAAEVLKDEKTGERRVVGDPTEAALGIFGEKIGFNKITVEEESPQTGEIPFDYKRKYHATLHRHEGKGVVTIVGAPEVVLALSSFIWNGDEGKVKLTKDKRLDIEKKIDAMSANGLRVLGGATLTMAGDNIEEHDMKEATFFCLYGLQDALRKGVKKAVKITQGAGIKVAMITGDYPVTARAIAKEAGIYIKGTEVMTGKELEELSVDELALRIKNVSVFARITPEQKMKIIHAYKASGEVIAMTGDGVNDAPSLVAADLGISMGVMGTEVAKEASDIVLLDDNFATITGAIEEGRGIYITIKKVVLYLFSTSLGEVGIIAGALFLGFPLPILPAQIIWLNFITDGFLNVPLGMEPQEKDLLRAKPIKRQFIIDRLMGVRMTFMALVMILGSMFIVILYQDAELAKRFTMVLTTLAVFQWFNVWNCRSSGRSIFSSNIFSNKLLIGAMGIVICLQLLAVYAPLFQKFLHTTALEPAEWALAILVASTIILAEEARKYIMGLVNPTTN